MKDSPGRPKQIFGQKSKQGFKTNKQNDTVAYKNDCDGGNWKWNMKDETFRNHKFQGVRMKLVLKICCSIQPTWTIIALQSYLTCREHGVRETTSIAAV